jgi:hypothetical protein
MSYPKDELAPPPAAAADAKSFEIARIWVADDAQYVALRLDVWPDPAAWGVVLAELARHVAFAYQRRDGHDFEDALERLLVGFHSEIEALGDSSTGEMAND